jgi:hypothetical protein
MASCLTIPLQSALPVTAGKTIAYPEAPLQGSDIYVVDASAMLEAIKQSRNESEANMSDESGQRERELPQEQEQTPKWGDPISAERQEELDTLAAQQRRWAEQPEATRGISPLDDAHLIGADVFWLAEQSGRDKYGNVPNLHLEGPDLGGAHLEGASLFDTQGARRLLAGLKYFVPRLKKIWADTRFARDVVERRIQAPN